MAALRYIYALSALSLGLLGNCSRLQSNEPNDRACSRTFSELAEQLSPGAEIVSPYRPEYERWQSYKPPRYTVVVEVAIEEDVQKTVSAAANPG